MHVSALNILCLISINIHCPWYYAEFDNNVNNLLKNSPVFWPTLQRFSGLECLCYDLHIIRCTAVCSQENILFGISVVTFKVSRCAEFQSVKICLQCAAEKVIPWNVLPNSKQLVWIFWCWISHANCLFADM